nr:hypothetical protein [Tanacetum cinerariifolium]
MQIVQPGMNMGQDRQMQMAGGNDGNQFRQYAGHNAGNPVGYNDVIGNQVISNAVQNPRVQNQASTSGTQTDSAPVYDSDGSAEVHENYDENCDNNEIFNMFTQEEQYTELLEPIPESHQVPQNDNDVISKDTSVEQDGETEAAKFVGDFKSLANESDASFAKYKALELEIKRLLKAVVSQEIMIIVQNESVVDTSDLQTELERTVRFKNDHIARIIGYGDYQLDNGTEFVNQTLREFYENVGISHQTSVAHTPQQNGVVKVQKAAAPRAMDLAGSPMSPSIDQDAPSTSIPSSQQKEDSPIISYGFEESPKTPLFHNDPLNESPHEDSTSHGSSLNVLQIHTPFEHRGRWTKDHPIANVIGDPSCFVFTRKQLKTDAMRFSSVTELAVFVSTEFAVSSVSKLAACVSIEFIVSSVSELAVSQCIMELYMMNRQHGRMILESVENGPLIWPMIEENGVTRPKKYSELSATEAIQADCDVKATNIILYGLPPEFYALVSNHRIAKDF